MRVIVTAGGTGGHIYPALAIIKKIKEKDKNSEFLYIGTHNRMEKDIVPNYGIKFLALEIYGFSLREVKRNIKNIFLIKKAYKKSIQIIEDFKPDIVIGVGGYVTYPVLKAAHKLKIKTFIHEQNAIPGKSNKALSKFVDVIGVSFAESKKYFPKNKVYFTGNPCSELALTNKIIAKTEYGFHKNKKLVIIVAGSLGSMTINKIMQEFLLNYQDDFEILYITGKNYYDSFIKGHKYNSNIKIVPYFENLSSFMQNADVVVTRAGATTISEIIALNIPAIFIPSPYVPNNHQFYNAKRLVDVNAALMIEEKDLTIPLLINKIRDILNNKEKVIDMKMAMKKLDVPNSSELIYNIIKDMIL